MSAPRTRNLLAAAAIAATIVTTAACGTEEPPLAGQPGAPSATGSITKSPTISPTVPTQRPTVSGKPSMDCPDTIATVRAAIQRAAWGQGAAKAEFQPVSVAVCQYNVFATGNAYATSTTKRSGVDAQKLLDLVNNGKVVASRPRICTADAGPTVVLRFTDNDRSVLSFAAESFGCHQLVATSFEGQGRPGELPAPRIGSPELIKALGLR